MATYFTVSAHDTLDGDNGMLVIDEHYSSDGSIESPGGPYDGYDPSYVLSTLRIRVYYGQLIAADDSNGGQGNYGIIQHDYEWPATSYWTP
jgi:hypothetical protein